MNKKRARKLNDADESEGDIVYWMSRDQRAEDNWALLFSQSLGDVKVVFCLVDEFDEATDKHYSFMIEGLKETEKELLKKNISFYLLKGDPGKEIPSFIKKHDIKVLVTDFDPLKIKRRWKESVKKKIKVPFYEVDAHNIVPCWESSPKLEYAAHTLRPKISNKLSEFLEEFPKLKKQKKAKKVKNDWPEYDGTTFFRPGARQAKKMLKDFISKKLDDYPEDRNDPNKEGTSDLSPYLHFGQISSQRVALEVKKSKAKKKIKNAFLEELIVRKELADNFCFYNKRYDSFKGFPEWARKTLDKHRKDKREYQYTIKQLEKANTHDELWNAAQREMMKKGKMRNYMRMYWGKKILEWAKDPEYALKAAIYLNNKYELDGRDPSSYAGIVWCIGGVHDRAWAERKIFGKIRYMSRKGCERKFDVEGYISKNSEDR